MELAKTKYKKKYNSSIDFRWLFLHVIRLCQLVGANYSL